MAIEFYTFDLSPFCRGVWMTLEALELKYTKNILNPLKGDTKTSEYAAINPRQTIPGIKDGSVALGESKAIACYLCNAHASKQKKKDLYPEDPAARARVDMVLYMVDTMTDKIFSYVNIFGVLAKGESTKTENIGKVHEALSLMEKLLANTQYIAGDHLTIADFFVYVKEGMLEVAGFGDYSKYPKLVEWKKKMSQLPYHKTTCAEPIAQFTQMYQGKLKEKA